MRLPSSKLESGGTNRPVSNGHERHQWTLIAAGMALLLAWVGFIEVPDRVQRIVDFRAQSAHAWDRHASALDRQDILAELRAERARLTERLEVLAGVSTGTGRPSAVLEQIEQAARVNGLQLLELRPEESNSGSSYTRLPIRIRLHGAFDGVRSLLRVVEANETSMRVREIHLRSVDPTASWVMADILLDLVVVEAHTDTVAAREER